MNSKNLKKWIRFRDLKKEEIPCCEELYVFCLKQKIWQTN